MNAKIFALSREVREAALDAKAVQRRIQEAGHRAHEWRPAQANARARMIALSLELGEIRERLMSQPATHPEPGEGYVRLAED
jgi:hypothetical protein